MSEQTVFIGLGSNLDQPVSRVLQAIHTLESLPDCSLQARSSLYRSAPMGPQDQPDYVNAVVQLTTRLLPEDLLDRLQQVERAHGRRRERRWGPRTLDLDILLYGDRDIASERLQVPHPGLAQRSFVLYPLAEIAGDLRVPGLGRMQALLEQCPRDGLLRLPESALHAG